MKKASLGTLWSKLESNNLELAIHSEGMQFTNMLENTEIFLKEKKIEKSKGKENVLLDVKLLM